MPVKTAPKPQNKIFSNLFLFVFLIITFITSLVSFYVFFNGQKQVSIRTDVTKPVSALPGSTVEVAKEGGIVVSELENLLNTSYTNNTVNQFMVRGITYSVPDYFIEQTPEKSAFIEYTPVRSFNMPIPLKDPDLGQQMLWGRRILNVYVIPYKGTIFEWAKESISNQGTPWGTKEGETFGEYGTTSAGSFKYITIQAGCCGGSELLYIIKIGSELLIFSSDNRHLYSADHLHSYLLDSVIKSGKPIVLY